MIFFICPPLKRRPPFYRPSLPLSHSPRANLIISYSLSFSHLSLSGPAQNPLSLSLHLSLSYPPVINERGFEGGDRCPANFSYGIERIPTTRIPITSTQVSELLWDLASANRSGYPATCIELVGKIKALAKESERNKRCIVSNGTARVLAASFCEFTAIDSVSEILSAIVGMFPLDEEARWHIGSPASLKSIVSILRSVIWQEELMPC